VIDLSFFWNHVTDAEGYRLYQANASDGPWGDPLDCGLPCFDTDSDGQPDSCEFTWVDLANDADAYFVVTAYNGSSESPKR